MSTICQVRQGAGQESSPQRGFFSALPETTLKMMLRLDLSEVLLSIVAQAAEIMKAPHGWIATVEDGEESLVVRHGVGFFREQVGDVFKSDQGISGQCLAKRAAFAGGGLSQISRPAQVAGVGKISCRDGGALAGGAAGGGGVGLGARGRATARSAKKR